MPRKPKPVRTFHPMAVAASLEAQSQAVLLLLNAVSTTLALAGDKIPAAVGVELQTRMDVVRNAMWPEDEDGN